MDLAWDKKFFNSGRSGEACGGGIPGGGRPLAPMAPASTGPIITAPRNTSFGPIPSCITQDQTILTEALEFQSRFRLDSSSTLGYRGSGRGIASQGFGASVDVV